MPIEKITQTLVGLAYCPPHKKRVDYFDTAVSGFVLETRPNGGKTYAVRYKDAHGRQRQFKIGNAADLTADKARKEAVKIRSRVTVGENPSEERQIKRTIPTIDELSTRYLGSGPIKGIPKGTMF